MLCRAQGQRPSHRADLLEQLRVQGAGVGLPRSQRRLCQVVEVAVTPRELGARGHEKATGGQEVGKRCTQVYLTKRQGALGARSEPQQHPVAVQLAYLLAAAVHGPSHS